MEVNINQILKVEVKKWLERCDDFVLEEDGDSGHGGGCGGWDPEKEDAPQGRKENILQIWKREHRLEFYFNCHDSPDFAPIENCWQAPKSKVRTGRIKPLAHSVNTDPRMCRLRKSRISMQKLLSARQRGLGQA